MLVILLVFSKNQFLALLDFSLLYFFYLITAFTFITSFLLISLDLVCFSFFRFLRWLFKILMVYVFQF